MSGTQDMHCDRSSESATSVFNRRFPGPTDLNHAVLTSALWNSKPLGSGIPSTQLLWLKFIAIYRAFRAWVARSSQYLPFTIVSYALENRNSGDIV